MYEFLKLKSSPIRLILAQSITHIEFPILNLPTQSAMSNQKYFWQGTKKNSLKRFLDITLL